MKYSAQTRGFYRDTYPPGKLPNDVVSISEEAYIALMAAQAGGYTIRAGLNGFPEAAELPAPPLTPADFDRAIQRHLDAVAQSDRWDDMASARAAAGVPLAGDALPIEITMHDKAVALGQWYFKVWGYAAQVEIDTLAGNRLAPDSVEGFVAELPEMVWPA